MHLLFCWRVAQRYDACDGGERVGSWKDALLSQVWEGCVQEQGFGLEEYVALGP